MLQILPHYRLGPNKYRLRTVIRIMAFVLKFIKLVKTKSPQKFRNSNDITSITLSHEEIVAVKK